MQFNSTTFFAEQVSIGIGGLIWICLFILIVVNPVYSFHNIGEFINLISVANLLFLFPVVYILGILIDRIADRLLENQADKLRLRYFPDTNAARKARNIIYISNCSIKSLFEYNRSRIRICRGWIFNSIMIVIALITYSVITGDLSPKLTLVFSGFLYSSAC